MPDNTRDQDLNNLERAYALARERNVEQVNRTLSEQVDRHENMYRHMQEQIRFTTVAEQRAMEQQALVQGYFPQAGKTSGFMGGMLPAMVGMGAGLLTRGALGSMGYGAMGQIIGGVGAGVMGYGLTSGAYEEGLGTAASASGQQGLARLQQIGPMSAYVSRQNWQADQGYIRPHDYFMASTAMPAQQIAESFGLNPAQFLPGAMDLVGQGLIAPATSAEGRGMTDVLKDAAVIFKGLQSFFGSVDIEGLKGQIGAMMQAGFTPEGMASLGRSMQASTLAFAPESVRAQIYQSMIQSGAALTQHGMSAHLGGEAAIYSHGTARYAFSGLSDYDKVLFRSPEGLGQAISTNIMREALNPLTVAGAGDPLQGMTNLAASIDMTGPGGMRRMRRAMYELSTTMSEGDLRANLDRRIRDTAETFGLDEEDAATAVLGDPQAARAYMIEREQRGETLQRNLGIFTEARIAGPAGVESLRHLYARPLTGSGIESQAMRGALRYYADPHMREGDMLAEHALGGLWNRRGWDRTTSRAVRGVGARVSNELRELTSLDFTGEGLRQRAERQSGRSLRDTIATELGGMFEGYGDARVQATGDLTSRFRDALNLLHSIRGQTFVARLREAVNAGSTLSMSDMAGYARELNLPELAEVLSDPQQAGAFLQAMEREGFTDVSAAITRGAFGVSSLHQSLARSIALEQDVFQRNESLGVMGTIGQVASNPMVAGAGGLITGVGVSVVAGPLAGVQAGATTMSLVAGAGTGLQALARLRPGYLSRDAADQLNKSAYGEQALVWAILSLLPENFFTFTGSTFGFSNNKEDRAAAAITLVTSIYAAGRRVFRSQESIDEETFTIEVWNSVLDDLNQSQNIRGNAQLRRVVQDLQATGRERLQNTLRVLFAYLDGTNSPATPETIERIAFQNVEAAATGGAGATMQRAALNQVREGLQTGTGMTEALAARVVTDPGEEARRTRLIAGMEGAVTDILRTTGTTADRNTASRVLQAVQQGAAALGTEATDDALVEVAQQAFREVTGHALDATRARDLISGLTESTKRSQRVNQLSDDTKTIIKTLLADNEIKSGLRDVLKGHNLGVEAS